MPAVTMRSVLFIAIAVTTTTASAEPLAITSQTDDSTIAVGARIGGYGFRRESDPTFTGNWNECRMNGVGIFANRGLRGPVFVEAGLDTYFSSTARDPMDLQIDRQSALLSTAIGIREHVTPWLEGYIQLGFGAELTKLSVPYGQDAIRADKIMPEGFLGAGGEIRVADKTRIGASIRTLVMGNFNYDPERLDPNNQKWTSTPTSDQVFAATPTLAAQAQFFVERDL
jgi:hypothetical protein